MARLVLIDGNSIAFRAFYALPPLTDRKGRYTQVPYGFSLMLFHLLERGKPDFLAVAFDAGVPVFRQEAYEAYKATRERAPEEFKEQLATLRELLDAFGIRWLELSGFEADDVIGTLAREARTRSLDADILSSDRDLLQLLEPSVRVGLTRKGVTEIEWYDEARFREEYGFPPASLPDYKGLAGDASDNIPGVPGIGDKTARKLLAAYTTLEGVYAHLEELSPKLREKLSAHREQAFLSRNLATIRRDLELNLNLEDLRYPGFSPAAVRSFLREYAFQSLLQRLPALARVAGREEERGGPRGGFGSSWAEGVPSGVGQAVQGELWDAGTPSPAGDETPGDAVTETGAGPSDGGPTAEAAPSFADPILGAVTWERLVSWREVPLTWVGDSEVRSFLETLRSGGTFFLAWDPPAGGKRRPYALAYADERGSWVVSPELLPRVAEAPEFRAFLADPAVSKATYDLKGAHRFALGAWGDVLRGTLDDHLLAMYLLDPTRDAYPPQLAASAFGGVDVPADEELYGKGAKFRRPPWTDEGHFLGALAYGLYRATPHLRSELEEKGLLALYRDLEVPLSAVLARMEHVGVRVDRDVLLRLKEEFGRRLAELEEEIYALAGVRFNLNSPKQLADVLFQKLGLPPVKKTKTGYSTDAETLEKLAGAHEVVPKLLDYRVLMKLQSTYVDGLLAEIGPDGKVHTTFNQAQTATGRLSSNEPNLQNIPIRLEEGRRLRLAFVPSEPGWKILSADYSQIELRVLAHFSRDPALLEAFHHDQDIHRRTAMDLFGVSEDQVTPEMRRAAKTVNFGIIYGISDYGLSQQLGIPRKEAAAFIGRYFAAYPGVKRYLDEAVERARRDGYVTTLFGRRRYLPEIRDRNFSRRSFAERTAMNTPIQGTAADIIKRAMLRVDERLAAEGLRARLLLQVHDELVFEFPAVEEPRLVDLVRDAMEGAADLAVPLKVDIHAGASWFEAKA
ncbi:MAG: DNA polymerase I [Brockia lithotrophica]|nr:DNA polymerase I [Brockia lithotrophica]MBT9253700.1 DNA polymerase I [Brockia lithotrophica]